MDVNEFENQAEQTLEDLFEALDEAIGDVVEVDFDNGVLTLELEDGRQYIINKHAPNQEIWLSSPLSGAAHYKCKANDEWTSTRGDASLKGVLVAEFKTLTGRDVKLG